MVAICGDSFLRVQKYLESGLKKKISISILSSKAIKSEVNHKIFQQTENLQLATGRVRNPPTNNWVYMMKHLLSMIKYLFMNYLPIFSRWL